MTEPLDNTTCEALRPLLLAHAAREIGEPEAGRVREHLETCASCRAEYQTLVRQLGSLTVLRDTAQPSEIVIAQLKNLARNEIQSETTIKQGLRYTKVTLRRGWLPMAASFAVVCAIVFLILHLRIYNIKTNSDNNNKNQIKTAQNTDRIGQKEDIDKGNTIIKDNNDKQWAEMMSRFQQLLIEQMRKKRNHLLAFTKDKDHLNDYLKRKEAILRDYFIIEDLDRFTN